MLKLNRKTVNNFRNCGCNKIQQKKDWSIDNGITTFSERYKRMELRIHLHVRVGLSEFCAILQYVETPVGESFSSFPPIGGSKRSRSDSHNLDNPMLIRIVNLFEPKEGAFASTPFGQIYGFEQRTTTGVVWLQPLDTCLMFRLKQFNHTLASFNPEFLFCQENRKLEPFVPCNCYRFIRTVQEGKLVDKMIKSRPEIMGNLSNINTPIKRRWRTIYFDAVDILSRYQILLCPDNTIMGINEKGILHQPQSVDFSFCSSNLESWAIERMHMLYYPQGVNHAEKDAKDSMPAGRFCPANK